MVATHLRITATVLPGVSEPLIYSENIAMTTWHNKLPFAGLLGRGRNTVAHADTEWESVMVQITLAFVIILGYLISKGISESQDLAAETALQRKQNQALEKMVKVLSNSEAGRERSQRLKAEQEARMSKLIICWLQMRAQRPFCQLIAKYRNADLVVLSDDLRSLPVASDFNDLNQEIDRIFLSGKGVVSPDELETLMKEVLTKAGYNLNAVPKVLEMGPLPSDAAEQSDDPDTPTWESLNMLRSQIVGDLTAERRELVDIQHALVNKINGARLKKLIALPLGAEGDMDIDVNAPDLGKVVLERILTDLRTEVRLLPEAEARIRGTSGEGPSAGQN